MSRRLQRLSSAAMFGTALALLLIAPSWGVRADEPVSATSAPQSLTSNLANASFEEGAVNEAPKEWNVPPVPGFTVATSEERPSAGKRCATILRSSESDAGPFGNLLQRVDAKPYQAKRVRFRAAVRADVEGQRNQAQLWLRVDRVTPDGDRALGAFDNMGNRPITSAEWHAYEIVADVAKDADKITLGLMFLGTGQVWIDDASLEVVGLDVPLTAKSPSGAARSGKPLEEIKPGLFEIVGSMRLMPTPDVTVKVLNLLKDDNSSGNQQVLIPLPLAYRDQVPLTYEFTVDPPGAIEAIEIYEDSPSNYVLKGTLADQRQWKHVDVKFTSKVLVRPSDFSDVPEQAPLPDEWPPEIMPWLAATWCADSEHGRIIELAAQIRKKTSDVPEIIRVTQATAGEAFGSAKGRVQCLTAVEALDKQGSCTSCANLVAALLRASGVPARVLAGYPSWSGPLQTHYIVEAYVPGYGWYPIESTLGQAPWHNTHQIHVAIVPPEHEQESKAGARPGIAGGVPYLSLTELPDNEAVIISIGTIEGARGCDHECRMIRKLEGTKEEWQRGLDAATSLWDGWLKSTHQLDKKGQIRFGRTPDGKANTVAALTIAPDR